MTSASHEISNGSGGSAVSVGSGAAVGDPGAAVGAAVAVGSARFAGCSRESRATDAAARSARPAERVREGWGERGM